jgi:SET domain-containing protein
MMLLIESRLGPSPRHGLGLFAAGPVSAGERVWAYQPGFDLELTEDQVAALSPSARRQLLHYAYRLPGSTAYILCGDDARFMNHAADPNVRCDDGGCHAARDIPAGAELTCDYAEFDRDFCDRGFLA